MSRSVRPCVCVTKRLGFGALDGVCRTSPRLLYSVGDCSMIQLNDSESLVSVLEGFSDHRARASWRHTNLLLFSVCGQTHKVDLGLGVGGYGPKSRKVDFCHIGPPSLTDSPVTSYAAPWLLSHPLTVQNHSRALHIHGSAPRKVECGVGLEQKNEIFKNKMKI